MPASGPERCGSCQGSLRYGDLGLLRWRSHPDTPFVVYNMGVTLGYTRIQLHTEYYRLPAVKTYLRLGYLPVIHSQEMYFL
jgi:hypothetical protein